MFRAPPMLLPHESTIGAGTGSAMVPSESSRGFGVGETISEGRENTLPLSPTEEEIGSNLPSEIANSENKMDDARKINATNQNENRGVHLMQPGQQALTPIQV